MSIHIIQSIFLIKVLAVKDLLVGAIVVDVCKVRVLVVKVWEVKDL